MPGNVLHMQVHFPACLYRHLNKKSPEDKALSGRMAHWAV